MFYLKRFAAFIAFLLFAHGALIAQETQIAPVPVQAALCIKLLPFNTALSGDIVLHVMDSPELALEVKKAVGKPIGKGVLKSVTEGNELPTTPPSAIIVTTSTMVASVVKYCRSKKVLSIAGDPALVKDGVALGIGVSSGKPSVLLNITASKEEGDEWNPALFKIALTVK